ncbi:hypothetical protein FYZ35_00750 [Mobiluncus mulieris]|uniref:hypothetical protein n=1 Tax=Mobiluncus mulieris TaxID=2052 RepID=UPI0021E22D43|nr:hypothetical protein [Mobiluncus mulieris]MCU9974646.1 hypothetical protein [Mobiluncus mulieris]
MSESTPAPKRSHRAAGSVDAIPRPRSQRDLSSSPRRRARLNRLQQDIYAAVSSATPNHPAETAPADMSAVSAGATDLLTRWLNENGFQNLAELQMMTNQADSERQRRLQPDWPQTRREKRQAAAVKPAVLPQAIPDSSAAASPVQSVDVAPEVFTAEPLEETPDLTPDITASARLALDTAVESSVTALATPVASTAAALRAAPTTRLERRSPSPRDRDRDREAARPQALNRHRRNNRAHAPETGGIRLPQPRPLAKSWKLPVLLTLGVLLFLLIAAGIPYIWVQTRGLAAHPEKVKVEVLGAVGAQPILNLKHPLPLEQASSEVVQPGTGALLEDGKTAAIRITVFSGTDGKLLSTGGDNSVLVGKFSPEVFGTEVYNMLRSAREGSRYLLKHPVQSAGIKGSAHMEIGVIDVLETSLRQAMTTLPPESGLKLVDNNGIPTPEITRDFSGDFRVDTLASGQGALVSAGQSVLVKYLEYSYSNPPVLLKNHWSDPVKLKLDDSIQLGAIRGIIDQRVGSRLVIQVPPAQGSGNQATILVVDILASWEPVHPKASRAL